MKKKVYISTLILLSFLNIILVNAITTIEKQPEKKYNMGDKIDLSIFVNIDTEPEKQVFVNADLYCNNHNLNFFKTPHTNNFIQLPFLIINDNFLGNCKVIISILDLNNNKLEKIETEEFIVTNTLSLDFSIDKEIYSPGNSILISGKLKKGAEIKIELKDLDKQLNFYQENLTTDIFSITLPLNENTAKGEKTIFIYGQDKYGNKAEDSKKIQVLQLPKTLKLELEKNLISPKEDITFISYILDQSGEKMNLEINYRIIDPENNIIESIKSNQSVVLNLQNPSPGDYIVKALYKNLEDVKKFSVSELRKIALEVENGIITITNIGNVKYIEEMTINATIDNIVYQIPISLNLRVNEKTLINLKNELPSENYDLTIYSQNETYSLDNVKVEDNRPTIKKISQGISKVTGSTIISTEKINNVFYIGFLFVFLGFIVTFITYRRFKNKITGIVDDTVITQKQKISSLQQSIKKW